jgi:hypothetical protein
MEDDYYDDDEDECFQPQALPVECNWTDEELERLIAQGPPSSAEEYLARVRYIYI